MTDDIRREIAQKILARLYEDWAHHQGRSLNALREEEQWEKSDFDSVIERLQELRLIKNGTSNSFRLTTDAIIHAEDNLIVSEEEVSRRRELRTKALGFLAELYQAQGSRAHATVEQIAEGCGVSKFDLFVDLELLKSQGYIKDVSTSSYQVTDSGRRYYHGADYQDVV
jgi:DNA-binding IclR family transcriptional regulator